MSSKGLFKVSQLIAAYHQADFFFFFYLGLLLFLFVCSYTKEKTPELNPQGFGPTVSGLNLIFNLYAPLDSLPHSYCPGVKPRDSERQLVIPFQGAHLVAF